MRLLDRVFNGSTTIYEQTVAAVDEAIKKYGEDQKTDQHDIDADKINAGHDGHTEIAVVQDTDKITDIYDCCYKTGVAQIFPDDIFFLDRFMKQNNINDCNQDGNNNVTV